ncbi:response regulator transcription factor [Frankia gtarii]|uniref:response regulator transcription factor n=1 Tax=Frankia gtarii TaxID=2950102 RepID=UPI0021BF3DA3|nr:LuxR C-terminal-related transcriptional regulator [Frankia gtarii]
MITAAIVENEIHHRQGLRSWIELHSSEVVIVAEVEHARELISLPKPSDVVLLDAVLNDGTRLAANIRGLVKLGSQIVVISAQPSEEMHRVALRAGALSVLHKHDGYDEVIPAVVDAAAGRPHITMFGARALQGAKVPLGDREAQVLRRYAAGMRTAEIAKRMKIAEETVKSHLSHIRDKYLEAGRSADLRRIAEEDGYSPKW